MSIMEITSKVSMKAFLTVKGSPRASAFSTMSFANHIDNNNM